MSEPNLVSGLEIDRRAGVAVRRLGAAEASLYEELDDAMVEAVSAGGALESHVYPTLLPTEVLERVDFFSKLPSVPFYAVPHSDGLSRELGRGERPPWVLNPSVCYHTFRYLEDVMLAGPLAITARAHCHRSETRVGPGRLSSFAMREFVFVGPPAYVAESIERAFDACLASLRSAGGIVETEVASDVFYGDGAAVARRVQLAMETKTEAMMPMFDSAKMAVGSKNRHGSVFAEAFKISIRGGEEVESGCVAFGLERCLLGVEIAAERGKGMESRRRSGGLRG